MITNGKAIRQALYDLGAQNVFRAEAYTLVDRLYGKPQVDKKLVVGLNWWIANGYLTFEGGNGVTIGVPIPGADYQRCGFLDKIAIQGLRQIANFTVVKITIENEMLVFTEQHKRMHLSMRFHVLEPVADGQVSDHTFNR